MTRPASPDEILRQERIRTVAGSRDYRRLSMLNCSKRNEFKLDAEIQGAIMCVVVFLMCVIGAGCL